MSQNGYGISYELRQRIRDFGDSRLCTRFNKRRSKIHQKTPLKSTLQLASILGPTWPQIGRVLGAMMGPRWHQICLKIDLQIKQKKRSHFRSLLEPILLILGTNMPPNRGSKLFIFGPLVRSWSHLGVKRAPRPPQDPPKIDF